MTSMAEAPAPSEPTAAQAAETMGSRSFVGLLVVVAVIGVIVSLAGWCYLSVFQPASGALVGPPPAGATQ